MIDTYFTITQDEYLEAQKLYMRSNRKARWLRGGLWAVLLVGVATVALTKGVELNEQILRQLAPVMVLVASVSLLPLLKKYGLKKRFHKEKQNLTNVHLILDEKGYHTEIPGIGGGVAEWAGMDGWLEGKNVFILRTGLLMRVFPKVPLSQDEVEEVRQLLKAKIGNVGVMRKP